MLHFSSFHPKHIKEAIPYRQALCLQRICSDEEECDGHLKILKEALIRMGYNAQLIDHQIRRATAKNRKDLLRRQTQDMTDRIPAVVQYFPGVERLNHVFQSLQHVIDDEEHLTEIILMPPLLAFKQPPNLKQTIVRGKLSSLQDINHNTTQACHGNLCKTCQIINMPISNNDETEYRREIECLVVWYKDNNLSLNVSKTKELIIDFGKKGEGHAPIYINRAEVEMVKTI
eukprot:g41664.t1